MKFAAKLLQAGKTATGIHVPDDVVAALGSSRKPAVTVTLNGHVYRSTIAVMGGRYMLPVSAEVRTKAGVAGGDLVEVEVVLDTAPRELEIPADLAEALAAEPDAKAFFDKQSYSNRRRHTLAIDGAKSADTRARRIAKSVEGFKAGKI